MRLVKAVGARPHCTRHFSEQMQPTRVPKHNSLIAVFYRLSSYRTATQNIFHFIGLAEDPSSQL
jgi:hypothetical protein